MAELNLDPGVVIARSNTLPPPPPEHFTSALGLNDLSAWFQEPDGETAPREDSSSRRAESEPPGLTTAPLPFAGLERLVRRRPYVVACGAALGSTVLILFAVAAAQLLTSGLERDSVSSELHRDPPSKLRLAEHQSQRLAQARR
jgi:hypothetical protein